MQASVRLDFNGQSLYWYPPPWLARRLHIVSTVEPAFQTAPDGILGSLDPRSPSFAKLVFVNSPWPPVVCGPPLARPHGSYTGAAPGARHGLNFDQSASEPATAQRKELASARAKARPWAHS